MPIESHRDITRASVSAFAAGGAAVRVPMRSTWQAAGNSTAITAVGSQSLSATGAATIASWAATTRYTQTRKIEFLVTTAAATAVAGARAFAVLNTIGSTLAGVGGFDFYMKAGPATGVAALTSRFFMGVANTIAAPTDVEPSSITNIVGIGWDSTDATVQVMHRGTAAVTKVATLMAIPLVDRMTLYELTLSSPTGLTQSVSVTLKNALTDEVFTTTISTNMPAASVPVGPRVWASVGGTSSVVGVGFCECELSPKV